MKKLWLKILLSLMALAGLAVGLIIFNINPILESLRPEIQRTIAEKIGQPITFGKLSLSLFPAAAVEVSEVRFEGAAEAGGVKTLILKTPLMPLLKRRLSVEEAGIDGLDVRLLRKADGALTINGIPAGAKTKTPEASASVSASAEPAPGETKPSVAFGVKNAW